MEDPFIHSECEGVSHPCFRCKMRLWRASGVPGVMVPRSFDTSGPTNREYLNDMFEGYKRQGKDWRDLEKVR